MARKWFKGSKPQESDPRADIEDLITLGELDEAERLLRVRLKSYPSDIHSRLRLAHVLMKQKRQRDAVEEYLVAAESYARDGFFDKASALLRKIAKLAPANENIHLKIEALQKAKALDRRRELIVSAILESGPRTDGGKTVSTLQLQQLWTGLCKSSVIDQLTDDQVVRLALAGEITRLDEGVELVARDGELEELLILSRGEVEARVTLKGGEETTIRSFTNGDVIGDRALLEHRSWPARYVVTKRTTALKLTPVGLAEMLAGETDPKGFLDTLRQQRHDHDVVSTLIRLEKAST